MAKGKPSEDSKAVARYAAAAFGGKPQVFQYLHDTEPLAINILSCADRPSDGIVSYSSIGLADYPMFLEDGTEFPTRVELAGACQSEYSKFANIMATAAFHAIRSKRLLFPGSVLKDHVKEYYAQTTVAHMFLTSPFLWQDTLKTLNLSSIKVSWLLIVPISDAECQYLLEKGDDALETLFEKHSIDIFDLDRPSVI